MSLHTRQSRRQFIKRTLATTGSLGFATASGQVEIRERSQIGVRLSLEPKRTLRLIGCRQTVDGSDVDPEGFGNFAGQFSFV